MENIEIRFWCRIFLLKILFESILSQLRQSSYYKPLCENKRTACIFVRIRSLHRGGTVVVANLGYVSRSSSFEETILYGGVGTSTFLVLLKNIMTETPDSTSYTLKRLVFYFIWCIIIVFYFSSYSSTNLLTLFYSVLVILPIRFFGDKKDKMTNFKSMYLRIINCRQRHKIRTILSWIVFLLFFIPSVVNVIGNIVENRAIVDKQDAYNKAPTPIIEILSKEWGIWNVTGYILIYKTKDATEVVINGKSYDKEGSLNYSLEWVWNNTLKISISAKNEYKSFEKEVVVTRDKTAEEIKMEKQEEIRIANEKKQEEIRVAKEQKQEELRKLQEESVNRKQYADLMRNKYLDIWLDIKVSVKWKNNTTLVLTYVLMGDVTVHQLREQQELEWQGMWFKHIDFKDGYGYHAWLDF